MIPVILVAIVYLALIVFMITSFWKLFEKAGRPGWAAIIPVYNYMVMAEIGQKPSWWGLMLLVPFANIVFMIMIFDGISKAFGKDTAFTVGLIFLGIVFIPMLAFGNAEYQYGERSSNSDLLDN